MNPDLAIKRNLLVVMPAFNESRIISNTLGQLDKLKMPKNWGFDVLIVDDGSEDDTSLICQALGFKTLRLPFNCGVGVALRTGFMWAKIHEFDAVIQLDADGQHPIDEIEFLLRSLEETDADIVVGSRFINGNWKVSRIRLLAMHLLATMVSFGTKCKITDATSGFRISGKRAIAFFSQNYPGEYLGDTVESLVLAHHEGLKISEIPANLMQRQGGTPSHLSFRSALHVSRVIIMLLLILIRPRVGGSEN